MLLSNESNALDFIDDFQGFLFTDEIYVFTPQGELRNLPKGSSILDFAYAIHSEIGNTCIGAKVNHKLTPLNYKLKSGDQVEIITSKKQLPKDEWFDYVVTARARTRIKNAIKEEKKKYFEKGRIKLEEYLHLVGHEINGVSLKKLKQKYNYKTSTDLYYDVAKDLIGLKEIRDCCGQNDKESWFSKMLIRPFTKSKAADRKTLTESVIEELQVLSKTPKDEADLQKISYDISSCCNPIPGDDIVGFIEPDDTIILHRINCPVAINKMSKYGNKIIKTKWNDKESIGFLTGIKINGIDKQGFINDVIKIITEDLKINIKSFHLESDAGMINGKIMLYVYSTANLNDLIQIIKKLPDVKKVDRINTI
jgi:GTP pyrophosphokinase